MRHPSRLLLPLLEGSLEPATRARVERHVAACHRCARELRLLRAGLAAARTLTRAAGPVAALSHRVHTTVLHRRRQRRTLAAAAVAVWLLSSLASFRLGVRTAASDAIDDGATYALFFLEPSWPPSAPLDRDGYAEHANLLRSDDRFRGGEKLTDDAGWLVRQDGRIEAPAANMSGWFLVEAASDSAALDVARRSPHLQWGSVLVRKVE